MQRVVVLQIRRQESAQHEVYSSDIVDDHLNEVFKIASVDIQPLRIGCRRSFERGVKRVQRAVVCSTGNITPDKVNVVAV